MKKLLIAVVLGLLLVAALATTALADNGPHGQILNTDVDKCAACHRAHTAQTGDGFLLRTTDITAMCVACHNGSGAGTDVLKGQYEGTAYGDNLGQLYGGSFGCSPAVHTWNTKLGYAEGDTYSQCDPVTSIHSVKGAYDPTLGTITYNGTNDMTAGTKATGAGTVWGSGDLNSTADAWNGTTDALECTSCHSPHGKAGKYPDATTSNPTAAMWASTAAYANVGVNTAALYKSSPAAPATDYATYGGLDTGAPMASYRILRFQAEGSNGFEALTINAANTVTLGFWTGSISELWWRTGNTQTTAGITVRESLGARKNEAASTTTTYTNVHWYTLNNDYTKDNTVQVYRSRWDGAKWSAWESYCSQRGDPECRTFSYVRPALGDYKSGAAVTTQDARYMATSSGRVSTIYTCNNVNTTGLGTLPTEPSTGGDTSGVPVATFSGTWAGTYYYPCGVTNTTTISTYTTPVTLTGLGTNGGVALGGAVTSDAQRFDNSAPRSQLSFFCAECHDRYLAASLSTKDATPIVFNSRTNNSGDSTYTYRHSAGGSVACIDCHFSHGTASLMKTTNDEFAGATPNSVSQIFQGVTYSGLTDAAKADSYLLKLDQRMMCIKCHGTDIGFQYATNTAP